MGNESRSRRAYLKLRELVRDLDPTRPVTYAENHLRRAVREKTVGIADVWGVNYELEAIDAACDASIFKNVVVSECSNYPPAVRGDLEKETEQLNLIESDLKKLEGKPHVAGFLIWCFNDYATLRKERYYRHCGIVDAWRVPKMSAAFLKAKFTTEPFVMVFGDWGKSQGEERGSRLIHIFTNCDEIVVYRNDKPLMSLAGAPYQTQAIAFEPGPLAIVGRKDGRETTYGLGTFADASRIDLRPEKSDADSERRESVGIVIRITDKVGQVVTSWNGKGRVSVEGAAFARTYRDDNVVDIAGGFGRFFITGNGQIGMAKIRASCETLEPAFEKVNFS
jgi:beta-galactosidase